MELKELHVYKLKVGLFAHRFNSPSNIFGVGSMVLPGSLCWLDQITEDDWAIFGLFGEEYSGTYVKCPVYLAGEQLEKTGEILEEKTKS